MLRVLAVLALVGLLVACSSAADDTPPFGALSELPGPAGCIAEEPVDGCADGRALNSVTSVAISPDGRFIYTAAGRVRVYPDDTGSISAFRRNVRTGGVVQLRGERGCYKRPGAANGDEGCRLGRALEAVRFVTVSPDGHHLYAGGYWGIAVFRLDEETGLLTQLPGELGCLTRHVSEQGPVPTGETAANCTSARAVQETEHITVTRDGRFVYAAGRDHAVTIFGRDPVTGVLSQLADRHGCVKQHDTAPLRGGPDEGCTPGRGLSLARSVTLSPDERFLYVSSLGNAIAVFRRDPHTGRLTQLQGKAGCVSEDGSDGCADGRAILGPHALTISADGLYAYLAGMRPRDEMLNGVAIFRVSPRTGVLRQLPGEEGCITEDGSEGCAVGRLIAGAHQVVLDPEQRTAYLISDGALGGVSAFRRNRRDGTLRELPGPHGCVNKEGAGGCAVGRRTGGLHYGVFSPDGRFMYFAGEGSLALVGMRRWLGP